MLKSPSVFGQCLEATIIALTQAKLRDAALPNREPIQQISCEADYGSRTLTIAVDFGNPVDGLINFLGDTYNYTNDTADVFLGLYDACLAADEYFRSTQQNITGGSGGSGGGTLGRTQFATSIFDDLKFNLVCRFTLDTDFLIQPSDVVYGLAPTTGIG